MMSKTDVRVIHVFPYSAKLAGGHSNAIIAFMKAQMQHGIDVRGLSPPAASIPSAQWRSVEHLPIQEMDFAAPDRWQSAMDLVAGCQRPIFHFHGFAWHFLRLARELVNAGIPYVVTSHGQLHYRKTVHWAKKFVYINFATRFFRDAGGLHFLTRREEDRFRYLMPARKKPALVQANVVEVPDPGTVRPASRESYRIPPGALVFAYLGRLAIEHKGLDVLVKGLARVQSDHNLFLLLIGPDWAGGRQRLQHLGRRLRCDGQMRFLGPHFGDSKWQLLKMADAFISPSRWDAFPIAVAEAMGFGLPTIVSERMNPALEYVAAGAAMAVTASPGALGGAMRRLANDPHLRQSLSAHGRKYVLEECSPQKVGACFEDFYLQALRGMKVSVYARAQPRAAIPDETARAVMNVVHVFPYSPRMSGGHSNAIRSFIACQKAKGIRVAGIAPKADGGAAETNWEFPLVEVDSLWQLRWAAIADQFAIAPGNSLLNFHSVNYRFAPLQSDLRRAGIPYVLTSHGQLNFRSALHGFRKCVYLNFVDRGPRKAAGLHMLTTLADRRLNLLMPGYSGLRLIQGNVVQLPSLPTLPAGSRSHYDMPPTAFVLVFLGRLDVRVKGLDLLVEAFSCLPADRFRLVMAGPDWKGGKARLEQLAERLGCRNRIHFPGPVYGGEKWSLLRMAVLFVSPSRWDAFSIAHAEALALGLPLVTSNKINMAPDLREADAALLVPLAVEPLAKAIGLLEADQELRRTLGNRGKAWAEMNCNPERAGFLFREFYQAILERTRNARV